MDHEPILLGTSETNSIAHSTFNNIQRCAKSTKPSTVLNIHTGIHTGGKTHKVNTDASMGECVVMGERAWLHDYIDASGKIKRAMAVDILERCIRHTGIPTAVVDVLKQRKRLGRLSDTSDLHVISLFFYITMLETPVESGLDIHMDRCIIDALYYNRSGLDKDLDRVYPIYISMYFTKIAELYNPTSIKLYMYYKLTYQQHLERLEMRSRGKGDIPPNENYYNSCILSIKNIQDALYTILAVLCDDVELIVPTYNTLDGVTITEF